MLTVPVLEPPRQPPGVIALPTTRSFVTNPRKPHSPSNPPRSRRNTPSRPTGSCCEGSLVQNCARRSAPCEHSPSCLVARVSSAQECVVVKTRFQNIVNGGMVFVLLPHAAVRDWPEVLVVRPSMWVTDARWARIEPHLPRVQRSPKRGRPRVSKRAVVDGILTVAPGKLIPTIMCSTPTMNCSPATSPVRFGEPQIETTTDPCRMIFIM